MKTIKAVAAMGDGTVQIVHVPFPTYGEYECLVRFTACGLCSGTDLKIISNGSVAEKKVEYPTLIGHEAVGIIEEVGPKVRHLHVGDRIVAPSARPVEGYHFNWGGMSEYGVTTDIEAKIEDGLIIPTPDTLRDRSARLIPDDISDIDAVMLLTMKENYSALKNFGVRKGMNLLIFGDGAVAQGLSLFAKLLGAEWVGCVGHHDDRLERIRKQADADLTVNSHNKDVAAAVGDRRMDVVIDAVGNVEIIKQGAKFLKPGGRVAVYGVLKKGHSTIDLLDLPNNTCVQILNWPYHEYREHDEICRLVREGKIDLKQFYSHVIPMEEAQRGVDMIRSREAFKVIFKINSL